MSRRETLGRPSSSKCDIVCCQLKPHETHEALFNSWRSHVSLQILHLETKNLQSRTEVTPQKDLNYGFSMGFPLFSMGFPWVFLGFQPSGAFKMKAFSPEFQLTAALFGAGLRGSCSNGFA